MTCQMEGPASAPSAVACRVSVCPVGLSYTSDLQR